MAVYTHPPPTRPRFQLSAGNQLDHIPGQRWGPQATMADVALLIQVSSLQRDLSGLWASDCADQCHSEETQESVPRSLPLGLRSKGGATPNPAVCEKR